MIGMTRKTGGRDLPALGEALLGVFLTYQGPRGLAGVVETHSSGGIAYINVKLTASMTTSRPVNIVVVVVFASKTAVASLQCPPYSRMEIP